jgi:hypothetical protein
MNKTSTTNSAKVTSDQSRIATLNELRKKLKAAPCGSEELDKEFAAIFASVPADVTSSIDAVVHLVEVELPGWWWSTGYGKLGTYASVYVPGTARVPAYVTAECAPDLWSGPEAQRLLDHPTMGKVFDSGFHGDRNGGTPSLAMLDVLLQGKIALEQAKSGAKPAKRNGRRSGSQASTRADLLANPKYAKTLARIEEAGLGVTEITVLLNTLVKTCKAGLGRDEISMLFDIFAGYESPPVESNPK